MPHQTPFALIRYRADSLVASSLDRWVIFGLLAVFVHLGSRSECESDQHERDGHGVLDFIVQCRDGGRVRGVGRVRSKPEVSLSRPPPNGMLTVIDIAHVHLGTVKLRRSSQNTGARGLSSCRVGRAAPLRRRF
jgi:hypothetical protein